MACLYGEAKVEGKGENLRSVSPHFVHLTLRRPQMANCHFNLLH